MHAILASARSFLTSRSLEPIFVDNTSAPGSRGVFDLGLILRFRCSYLDKKKDGIETSFRNWMAIK